MTGKPPTEREVARRAAPALARAVQERRERLAREKAEQSASEQESA